MNHWYLVGLDIFSVVRWILPLLISITWWEMMKAMLRDRDPAAINLMIFGTAILGFLYYNTLFAMEPSTFWINP